MFVQEAGTRNHCLYNIEEIMAIKHVLGIDQIVVHTLALVIESATRYIWQAVQGCASGFLCWSPSTIKGLMVWLVFWMQLGLNHPHLLCQLTN